MEIAARAHADFHEEETAKQRGNGAGNDAECIHIYGIHSTEETVRIQRENRSEETVVEHASECLFHIASVFSTPDIFQTCPVGEPVIIPGSGNLTDDEKQQQQEQDEIVAAMMHVFIVHSDGYSAACYHLGFRAILHIIRIVHFRLLHDNKITTDYLIDSRYLMECYDRKNDNEKWIFKYYLTSVYFEHFFTM